jgi:hypothetical protein
MDDDDDTSSSDEEGRLIRTDVDREVLQSDMEDFLYHLYCDIQTRARAVGLPILSELFGTVSGYTTFVRMFLEHTRF